MIFNPPPPKSPCHKLSQILDPPPPLKVCHTSEQKVNKQITIIVTTYNILNNNKRPYSMGVSYKPWNTLTSLISYNSEGDSCSLNYFVLCMIKYKIKHKIVICEKLKVTWSLPPLPLSQTVTLSQTPSPLERDILYGQPLTVICDWLIDWLTDWLTDWMTLYLRIASCCSTNEFSESRLCRVVLLGVHLASAALWWM